MAALAGALVTLAPDGTVGVMRSLLHHEGARNLRAAAAANSGKAEAGSAESGAEDGGAGRRGVSAWLCRELSAYKTEALQVALLHKPQVALEALAHAMATGLLYDDPSARYESPSALSVSVQSFSWSLKQLSAAIAESPARKNLSAVVEAWRERLPSDPKELFPFLLEQPAETLQEMLVLCAALTAHALHGSDHVRPAQALATASSLDMADCWEATGTTYLSRVPKALIAQALTEAGKGDAVGELARLKKGEAVGIAEGLLAGKRWLP